MKVVLAAIGIALASATATAEDTIFELRQYTLHPGQRDILVDVFDDNFVEGQEATGMRIIGQYRDLDDPTASCGCAAFPIWNPGRSP